MAELPDFDQQYPADAPGQPAPPVPPENQTLYPPKPTVGIGEDIAKSAGPSLVRGTAGLFGLPGTAQQLWTGARGYLEDKAGLSPAPQSGLGALQDAYLTGTAFGGPITGAATALNSAAYHYLTGTGDQSKSFDPSPTTPAQFMKPVEDRTGPLYEAQRVPGQLTSAVLEAAPSAVLPGGGTGAVAKTFNTVVPAITGEAAAQFAKGTPAEKWVRGIGGVIGGFLGAKALTPSALPSAEHQAAARVMEQHDIPLWASDRTGSRFMKVMESSAADMPWSAGPAQARQQAQNTAYNRAMTAHAFDPVALESQSSTLAPLPAGAALPNRNVMQKGAETLSDDYNRILANTTVQSNPALQRSLLGHQTNFENMGLPSQADINAVATARNQIVDRLIQGGGSIPGPQYQAIRKNLGDLEAGARSQARPDSRLAEAYGGMRQTLDDAARASLSPADARALDLTNQRYAIMKQLEPVVANTKGADLVPSQVASGMAAGRVTPAARGLGAADELANAAALIMKPLPNSLTAVRSGMQTLFSAPAAIAAGAAANYAGHPLLAAAMAVPHIVGRAVVSEPVQRWLGNTILPQDSRAVIANALTQQAMTQPLEGKRIDAAQADWEAQKAQHLRDIGLAPGPPAEPFNLPPTVPNITVHPRPR